ncbi:MAG: hypothetical protein AAFY26_00115 [Cyanobacteria bacterium J06638_22]
MRVAPLALTTLAAFTLHEASREAAANPIPVDTPNPGEQAKTLDALETSVPAEPQGAIAAPETQVVQSRPAEKPLPTPTANPTSQQASAPMVAQAIPVPPPPQMANEGGAEPGIPIPVILEPSTEVEPTPSQPPTVTERSPVEAPEQNEGLSQAQPDTDEGFVIPIAPVMSYGDEVVIEEEDPLYEERIGSYHIRIDPTLEIDPNARVSQTPDEYAAEIRACMAARPELYRLRESNGDRVLVPVLFDGQPGTIIRDANGRLVCPSTRLRASSDTRVI